MVHYNMSFQIAAIVLVLLVTVHFILQKKLHDTGTKIFLAVLFWAVCTLFWIFWELC